MNDLALITSVVWIDLLVILFSKTGHLGKTIGTWYKEFGITAVFSDCLIIILGIYIASYLFPNTSTLELIFYSIIIQIIHDVLFYLFIIVPLPRGSNRMIDVFKDYANETSYKPIIADSMMIGSSVFLYKYLQNKPKDLVSFLGFLGSYLITYLIY
jgi:uncharacterized protein YacL